MASYRIAALCSLAFKNPMDPDFSPPKMVISPRKNPGVHPIQPFANSTICLQFLGLYSFVIFAVDHHHSKFSDLSAKEPC
jgi:hypothetical protein